MKNILIVALFITLVASRVHLKDQDPVEACMNSKCKGQLVACTRNNTCLPTLQNCGKTFEKDMDFQKFDSCLGKSPQAYNLVDCLMNKCIIGGSQLEVLEMLYNKMN